MSHNMCITCARAGQHQLMWLIPCNSGYIVEREDLTHSWVVEEGGGIYNLWHTERSIYGYLVLLNRVFGGRSTIPGDTCSNTEPAETDAYTYLSTRYISSIGTVLGQPPLRAAVIFVYYYYIYVWGYSHLSPTNRRKFR